MPFQFVTEYFNDFDDAVVAPMVFTDSTGLGNASEAGTQLTLNQLGLNNWAPFNNSTCAVTRDRDETADSGLLVRYELKVNSVSMSQGTFVGMHAGPVNNTRANLIGFRRDLTTGDYYYYAKRLIATGQATDLDELIGSSPPGPHWLRFYYNNSGVVQTLPESGSPTIANQEYAFYVSTDGTTYTLKHQGTADTSGNKSDVGAFAIQEPINLGTPRTSQIVCDWLRIENWELVLGPTRMYIGGTFGQMRVYDAETFEQLLMPTLETSWAATRSIKALATDDVWAGREGPPAGHPWLAHFDGTSWTKYELTFMASGTGNWIVADIVAFAPNDVYALVGNTSAQAGAIVKWDGVSWTKLTDTENTTSFAAYRQLWGSSGDDLYVGNPLTSNQVGHWNGTTYSNGGPSAAEIVGGCVRSDGAVFALDDLGDLYRKGATVADWTLERDINVSARITPVESRLWINPETDDIYTLTGPFNNNDFDPVLNEWDGSTWVDTNIQGDTTARLSAVEGVIRDDGAQIWVFYQSSSPVYIRDPTTGTWSSVNPVFTATAAGGLKAVTPSITIGSVTPAVINQEGGTQLVLTLSDASAGEISVFIDGVRCYGGQGFGYTPITDGSTVTVYTPKLDSVGTLKLTAQQGEIGSNEVNVTVLEQYWHGKRFGLRPSFPFWFGVGPRRLDGEPS